MTTSLALPGFDLYLVAQPLLTEKHHRTVAYTNIYKKARVCFFTWFEQWSVGIRYINKRVSITIVLTLCRFAQSKRVSGISDLFKMVEGGPGSGGGGSARAGSGFATWSWRSGVPPSVPGVASTMRGSVGDTRDSFCFVVGHFLYVPKAITSIKN